MRLVLDTNAIIDFLKETDMAYDVPLLIEQHECFISVITKLELLKYREITCEEEAVVLELLQLLPIMPLNAAIETETIAISRATHLKLPDAIIGATAIVYGAAVVTSDLHFLNCVYAKLNVWQTGTA